MGRPYSGRRWLLAELPPLDITVLPPHGQLGETVHHLLWPRTDFAEAGLLGIRELPCARVISDARVHRLSHLLFEPTSMRNAAMLQGIVAIGRRHEQRRCRCTKPWLAAAADALTLGRPVPSQPACTIWIFDLGVLAFLREFQLPSGATLGPSIRPLLELEHRHRRCSCHLRRR